MARASARAPATDAAIKGSAEWALRHSFWQTYKLVPRLAVALQTTSRLAALEGFFKYSSWVNWTAPFCMCPNQASTEAYTK
jgi:hypothetical protein